MNKEKLAKLITGSNYPFRLNKKLKELISNTNLIIVYGLSDDLMEFEGAIRGEINCFGGGTAYFHKYNLIKNECEDSDCCYFRKIVENKPKIKAIWNRDNILWTYKTDICHSTFDIIKDNEIYCRGLVFNQNDIG